jgi:hypothetical protein
LLLWTLFSGISAIVPNGGSFDESKKKKRPTGTFFFSSSSQKTKSNPRHNKNWISPLLQSAPIELNDNVSDRRSFGNSNISSQ